MNEPIKWIRIGILLSDYELLKKYKISRTEYIRKTLHERIEQNWAKIIIN